MKNHTHRDYGGHSYLLSVLCTVRDLFVIPSAHLDTVLRIIRAICEEFCDTTYGWNSHLIQFSQLWDSFPRRASAIPPILPDYSRSLSDTSESLRSNFTFVDSRSVTNETCKRAGPTLAREFSGPPRIPSNLLDCYTGDPVSLAAFRFPYVDERGTAVKGAARLQ